MQPHQISHVIVQCSGLFSCIPELHMIAHAHVPEAGMWCSMEFGSEVEVRYLAWFCRNKSKR